jgi:hypothetical protein
MISLTKQLGLAAAVLSLVGLAESRAKADLQLTVTPTNLYGWSPRVTDSSGSTGGNPTGVAQFVTGPGTPPLGIGSVNLATGDGATGGDGSAQFDNTGYAGVLLSSITALSYSTYVTENNGQQLPYLNLVLSNGDKLYFEPPYQTPSTGNPALPNQGATALNTWQTWNAFTGGWYSDNGPGTPGTGVVSLAAYELAHPGVTIENQGSALAGIRLNVGFGDPTDQFNGYVDNFTIGINGSNTTYNFEPAAAVPEPSTLAIAGLGVLGFLGYGLKRRVKAG